MRPRLIALCAALVAASALVSASTATFWTVSTQTDFLKGDVENLSIDSDGRVFLGPSTTQLAETAAPFLWTLLAAPDGTLYAGTGNQGQVLKVTRDGTSSVFFHAPELEVHALAFAPGGGLYVATSPDGKIYHVAADGTSKTFFAPGDKYIWALAVAGDGTVYAATGEKGVVYRISPDGKGAVLYKAAATNVVSLAIDTRGSLIAGTESPGRVFRISPDGKAFVLLDSPYKEMHAVRVAADGTIYAAAFSGTPSGTDSGVTGPVAITPPTAAPSPVPTVTAEITGITVIDAATASGLSGSTTTGRDRSHPPKGAIYRIRPDGLWDTVWEATDDWPFDVLMDPDGTMLVATGKDGKVFRLAGEPARATLLARAPAHQVTALVRDASGRVLAATSNPGKILTLGSARASSGTYSSDVRDAGTVATWGAIRWRASGSPSAVELSTRTGNTATPDDTWSAWSPAYAAANADHIVSPNARYLQWRAVLKATSSDGLGPVLTSVTAAYLPRNLRPVVTSITVHPPGVVFQKPFSTGDTEIAGFDNDLSAARNAVQDTQQTGSSTSLPTPTLGRKTYQKGLQTFVWKAEDENDDRLAFDVFYRGEGETGWTALKRGLTDPIFVWDTTSVPDGTYYVKVAASDAPSNSPATALVGEFESVSFDVDNTPPVIEVQAASMAGNRASVKFVVRDAQSAVMRVEYSLDASRWLMAYPLDGIADSQREEYDLTIDGADGARRVIIRATDTMNNVVTAVADLKK